MTDNYLPFGVDADTGRPLDSSVPQSAQRQLDDEAPALDAAGAPYPRTDTFGVLVGYDPDDLSDVGWGLVFANDVDPAPYIEQLRPLLDLRQKQAGTRYRVFAGADGPAPRESAQRWLNRHGASLMPLDPEQGVPFYLLLVGPPTSLSFEFQYSLDIVAGVGRVDFDVMDDYRHYANSVVRHEREESPRTRRTLDLFATCHDFDAATQLFTDNVARPLSTGPDALGTKYGFSVNPVLTGQSTKGGLTNLLSTAGAPPSLLFTGTHGMAFRTDDPRHREQQGALVCQDWPGYGTLSEEHWFAAADVPGNANIHGMIHFFFACYGNGTPEHDNFRFGEPPKRIADKPITARLPQRLLALPQGGALASLGHVDRAWASSFVLGNGKAQTNAFRDVIHRLMLGSRVGYATDQFNTLWGGLSTELVELLNDQNAGARPDPGLMALRIARDDLRNYVVMGDPAVRLRPEPQLK